MQSVNDLEPTASEKKPTLCPNVLDGTLTTIEKLLSHPISVRNVSKGSHTTVPCKMYVNVKKKEKKKRFEQRNQKRKEKKKKKC